MYTQALDTHGKEPVPSAAGATDPVAQRFQERIDQLKRTMKTDSAVNLGISVKRLLSLVDEAEQLQKGNAGQEEKR